MRRILLLTAVSLMIFSCSDEKENQIITGEIVGQWTLIYAHARSWDSYISNESDKNIVYDFKSNGILFISGDQIGLHSHGQHNYSIREKTLTLGEQNYESLIVRIGNKDWVYSFSDGQMRLYELDSDGGSLTFIKK